MPIAILDTKSELFTTSRGVVLMVKLVAVGAAAAIGAYVHFARVPTLEIEPHDPHAADRLRRLVQIEGCVLMVVGVFTAVLVGSAW